MIAIAEFLLPLNPGLWLIIGAFVAILLPQSLSRWFGLGGKDRLNRLQTTFRKWIETTKKNSVDNKVRDELRKEQRVS